MAGTNFMEEHRSIHADVSREASGFSAYSWVLHATLGLLATFSACTAPRGPLVVTDPDPSIKIPAIEKAVRTKDRAAIPQLIKDLDSDDAAVRLYANHALEQLTGKNFGYRYFDNPDPREAAAQKWRDWLNESSGTADKPLPAAGKSTTGPS